MALDDYVEPEVAVAVAVTAAVASPTMRKFLRMGAVYGLAGLLMARDKIAAMATNVSQTAQRMAASTEESEPAAPQPAPRPSAAETATT